MRNVYAALIVGLAVCASASAAEEGLVGLWDFSKGSGTVLHDRSDQKNDGTIVGAKWVKLDKGYALKFDGTDDYVNCGTDKSLHISGDGSIVCWVNLGSYKNGAIVQKGNKGHDQLNNYFLYIWSGGLRGGIANGVTAAKAGIPVGKLELNRWHHVAVTWDASRIELYLDGLLSSQVGGMKPKAVKEKLQLGTGPIGGGNFNGLLAHVAVYRRALSDQEVFSHYKQEAANMGKDTTLFHRPVLTSYVYRDVGKILANVDFRAMRPLPEGSRIKVELSPTGKEAVLSTESDCPSTGVAEVAFDATRLARGSYDVSAIVTSKGKGIGKSSKGSVQWPGRPSWLKPGMKVMNNLVIELANVHGSLSRKKPLTFTNPRDGWVFLSSEATGTGKANLLLDWGQIKPGSLSKPVVNAIISHEKAGVQETMRYLSEGEHKINVITYGKLEVAHLVVRAVPEMLYCRFQYNPHVTPYGPYDWDFLRRSGTLSNVNVIIGSDPKTQESHIREWKSKGGRWILERWIGPQKSADECYQRWARTGFDHPLVDGVMVDEFGSSGKPMYIEATKRMHKDFPGKIFYPYCGAFYSTDSGQAFARLVMEYGYKFSREEYLPEQPTQDDGWRYLKTRLGGEIMGWQRVFPDAQKHIVMCFGVLCSPPESLNRDPSVDYKVWQDMQFNFIANNPSFFGLHGIMEYTSGYADEESLRWIAKLYRHYCIEGKTEMLSKQYGFAYKLNHIENPDFEEGKKGWTLTPCRPDSIGFGSKDGLSWAQGRYPRTSKGDVFLWMKRCAERPNSFSQTIKNLTPGKLYSVKMYAGEHKNLQKKQKLAVSVKIDNVDLVKDKCFQHVYGNYHVKNTYFNFFNYVFKPKGETATVTVSDWASDPSTLRQAQGKLGSGQAVPGGPVGQEIFFNFVEIQPYLPD